MTNPAKPDFLVIGGGVAGCVAARTLADSGAVVTLLEAGPAELPSHLRGLDWIGAADGSEWLWDDPSRAPKAATPTSVRGLSGDSPINLGQKEYLRGRGLGGGSAINGMVADVDKPQFYDSWPQGWRFAELGPFLDRVVETMGVWQPASGKLSSVISQIEGTALESLSLFGQPNGGRRTFADAYLQGSRGSLSVQSDASVQRVLYDATGQRNKAIGVELSSGEVVYAGNVVLCAGTFGTAALLGQSEITVDLQEPQDHTSKAVTLDLVADYQTLVSDCSPLTAKIAGDGYELLVLDHVGDRNQGALMVGETASGGLHAGVAHMEAISNELKTGGVATGAFESPGGYYHAASTLPGGSGVDSSGTVAGWDRLHVMDASVLPSLVRCSPSVTIAAVAAMLATNLANTN